MPQQDSYPPRRKAIAPDTTWDEDFGVIPQMPVQSAVANNQGSHPTGHPTGQYAEDLMDELFAEVEHSLDHANLLPTEPVRFEPTPPVANTIQQFVLSSYAKHQASAAEAPLEPLPRPQDLESLLSPPASPTKARNGLLDKLLIGVGCASTAAIATAWWVTSQTTPKPANTTAQLPTLGASTPFIGHLQRSLAAIDRRDPTKQASVKVLPTPGTAGGKGTAPNSAPPTTVIPLPSQLTLPQPPATGLSKLMPPLPQLPQIKLPQMKGSGQAAPSPSPAGKALPSTLPPLSPNQVPTAPSASTVPLTLVAVMDWGDRSAALIELNGITQRFRPGETIGNTGWSLVKVAKNEAVLRRNGEVRSIYTGQQF